MKVSLSEPTLTLSEAAPVLDGLTKDSISGRLLHVGGRALGHDIAALDAVIEDQRNKVR